MAKELDVLRSGRKISQLGRRRGETLDSLAKAVGIDRAAVLKEIGD